MVHEAIVATDDVFKTSRGLPLNYVTRAHADERFIDALTKESHIVIYGSSKQGKTSLRKYNLQEKDYIELTCSNNWDLADLMTSMLKAVGYKVTVSESKTLKGTSKIKLNFDFPLISVIKGGAEIGHELAKQINKKRLELDPDDVNDVIGALREINFEKYIVIEDFHYLPEKTQIDFAIALKAFHETSKICFIIVGVWLEEDRLTVHNGDLTGRVISINADLWTDNCLDALINNSAALLNLSFTQSFVDDVKSYCNGSVFLAQQLCYEACKAKKIYSTQQSQTEVGANFNVKKSIKSILENQNARYFKFITDFSSGFDQTELDLYKWILYAIIVSEKIILENGLAVLAARRYIIEKHPKRSLVTTKKIMQSLRKSVDLQVKNSIQPIVFEYDSNKNRIKIVDRSFLLWREYQDRDELFELADLSDDLKLNDIKIMS